MIDFRYHLVSIVAVFLALAIGIVIGAQALRPAVQNQLNTAIQKEKQLNDALAAREAALTKQLGAADAFAKADYRYLLGQLLAGQQVVVVTAPGADGAAVSGAVAALNQAGATVTGQVSLQQSFFDTSRSGENTLSQAATRLALTAGINLGAAAAPPVAGQQAMAVLIADAIAQRDGPSTLTAAQQRQVLSGLSNQGYLQISGRNSSTTLAGPAALAVMVSPATPPASDVTNQALLAVAAKLKGGSRGVVLAGTTAGSGSGSAISDVRSGAAGIAVATVDDADTTIGQIMVVQALRLLLRGGPPASYGVDPGTAPSPAPSGPVSPSPSTSLSPSPPASPPGKRTRG